MKTTKYHDVKRYLSQITQNSRSGEMFNVLVERMINEFQRYSAHTHTLDRCFTAHTHRIERPTELFVRRAKPEIRYNVVPTQYAVDLTSFRHYVLLIRRRSDTMCC